MEYEELGVTNDLRIIRNSILSIDFNELQLIKDRELESLSDNELKCIGLHRIDHIDGLVYCCKDIFGSNRFYSRETNGNMTYHCCNLGCKVSIKSTKCLIINALLNWKLKTLGLMIELQVIEKQ